MPGPVAPEIKPDHRYHVDYAFRFLYLITRIHPELLGPCYKTGL